MEVLSADLESEIGPEGAGDFRNRPIAAAKARAGWTWTVR
jgi:hypothetical protein